jgi:hypothetical protein
MPDLRFIGTGLLLKNKEIKFREIYDKHSLNSIREVIGATYPRIQKLIEDPTQWTWGELTLLAGKMQLETIELAILLDEDIRRWF